MTPGALLRSPPKRSFRFHHFRSAGSSATCYLEHRRFVGVWVSSTGFVNSNRQFMLVITNAERQGTLTGFTVRGPPQALSFLKAPAGSFHFKARVIGNSFR